MVSWVTGDNSKLKKFLESQKKITDLIPKSKKSEIYDGLITVLQKDIDNYISKSVSEKSEIIKNEYLKKIETLSNRISELEILCKEKGIKTGVDCEDVYPSGRKYCGD